MLILAVVIAAGCKKPDDPTNPNNGGNNEGGGNGGDNPTPTVPTEEGMYLGIIGFNEQLYQKDISLLNSSTKPSFDNFIENLNAAMGTGLYYADYTALKELQSFPEPPKLNKVAMVTFTDGIDNVSTSNSQMDPEGYGNISTYRSALHYKIMSESIHGQLINAYTIGLRGNDFTDLNEFRINLNMLASSPNNVFEVTDMAEALQRFKEIAEDLYSSTTIVNLKVKVPGGYDDGQVIRFPFDNSSAGNWAKYIEATYKRNGNTRSLENVSFHGFTQGSTTLSAVSQTGAYYWFEFENLTYPTGGPITQQDLNNLSLWKKNATGWQHETEFEPGSSSEVTEEKSSAMIMLVLDCTTSLGNDFAEMKNGAKRFVETLVSSSGNGNGGGNGGGGSNEPVGIINGKFSVNANQKVYFSQGNLQYQASTDKWRFAANQYDIIGDDNGSISEYNSNWIDLFGWGTSNFMHGANCYQPWSTSQSYNDYYAYGLANYHLYDDSGLADWGANAISNGGNETRLWRTLTKDEWTYLLQTRSTSSGMRFAKAEVVGKKGILLFPDNWDGTTTINNADVENAPYSDNEIQSQTWSTLQSEGIVFLPAAGSRDGISVSGMDTSGYYWSSSCFNDFHAYLLSFNNTSLNPNQNDYKYYGQSVRLVCNAN